MMIPWTRVWAHEVDVLQCGTPQRLLLSRYSLIKGRWQGLSFDLRGFIEDQPYVTLLVRPGRTFVAQFKERNKPYPPPGCWVSSTLEQTEFLIPASTAQDCSSVELGRRVFAVNYHCDDTPNLKSMLLSGLVLYPVEDPQALEQAEECPADLEFWPRRRTNLQK